MSEQDNIQDLITELSEAMEQGAELIGRLTMISNRMTALLSGNGPERVLCDWEYDGANGRFTTSCLHEFNTKWVGGRKPIGPSDLPCCPFCKGAICVKDE